MLKMYQPAKVFLSSWDGQTSLVFFVVKKKKKGVKRKSWHFPGGLELKKWDLSLASLRSTAQKYLSVSRIEYLKMQVQYLDVLPLAASNSLQISPSE